MDDQQAARAKTLLGINGAAVRAVEPDLLAGGNALGALAFAWNESTLVATAYDYESYEAATEAEKRLLANADDRHLHKSTVNGSLLLWAQADSSDISALQLLDNLVQRFAGEE